MSRASKLMIEVETLARSADNVETLMQRISDHIHASMTRYNWVGFYLADKTGAQSLVVGPFAGSFTPRPRISFDQGLCGAAAVSGKTVVVNNIPEDPRYLGSELVKSEIVAPIFAHGKLFGEFNVESYFANTFHPDDCNFVESCASLITEFLEGTLAWRRSAVG